MLFLLTVSERFATVVLNVRCDDVVPFRIIAQGVSGLISESSLACKASEFPTPMRNIDVVDEKSGIISSRL